MKYLLLTLLLLQGCVTTPDNEPLEPIGVDVSQIHDAMRSWEEHELTKEGYLKDILGDCDGALWQGQWCAATGCDLTKGYEGEPGRFYRRATAEKCWHKGEENGSKTTWSRDMFVCGLLPWALLTKDLPALDRHARYGWSKNWVMGEPPLFDNLKENSRLYYTPSIRALLYKSIKHLGGYEYPGTAWDWIVSNFKNLDMSEGLEDYQAHLQVCKIWGKSVLDGGISDLMKERVKTHHKRVPSDPFYAFMYGKFYGDWGQAAKACTAKVPFSGDYVRCGKSTTACAYAHSVFSCNLLLKEHEG